MSDHESQEAQAKPQERKKKQVTPEEFITRWPLYALAPVDRFYIPNSVSFHCDNPSTCGKETTWLKMLDPQYVNLEGASGGFKWVWYRCGLCNHKVLIVLYREVEREQRPIRGTGASSEIDSSPIASRASGSAGRTVTVITKIQKIGQYPAQSINVPLRLQKSLGEEGVSLYKKGLINRNEGYGLGALTYIRRVVEDKTNELIEVAAQLAESHHVDTETVNKIRAAATERTTYDQKLKIASTIFPAALLIEGVNPLAELYSLVSGGVHGLSEEDCIAVADETTSVFEFIFTNLRAQMQARQGFVEKVRKWAGRTAQRESEKGG
jgi:hypothetical protein